MRLCMIEWGGELPSRSQLDAMSGAQLDALPQEVIAHLDSGNYRRWLQFVTRKAAGDAHRERVGNSPMPSWVGSWADSRGGRMPAPEQGEPVGQGEQGLTSWAAKQVQSSGALQAGDEVGFTWYDPDQWYHGSGVTFSFIIDKGLPDGGALTTLPGSVTHSSMWDALVYDADSRRWGEVGRVLSDDVRWRIVKALEKSDGRKEREKAGALDGRTSGSVDNLVDFGSHIVSFWPDDIELYRVGLENCLRALYREGALAPESTISTPVGEPFVAAELDGFLGQLGKQRGVDPEEVERRAQLHLMRAGDKKAALQALGARPKGPHPWSRELASAGVSVPGAKPWAFSSEGRVPRFGALS